MSDHIEPGEVHEHLDIMTENADDDFTLGVLANPTRIQV